MVVFDFLRGVLIMAVEFPLRSGYVIDNMAIGFPVIVDGLSRRALVSEETLQDHFGAKDIVGEGLVHVFEQNREFFQNKVLELIKIGVNGDLIIKTNMF